MFDRTGGLTEHPIDQYIFPEKEEGWFEMEVWMVESDNNERTILFRKPVSYTHLRAHET